MWPCLVRVVRVQPSTCGQFADVMMFSSRWVEALDSQPACPYVHELEDLLFHMVFESLRSLMALTEASSFSGGCSRVQCAVLFPPAQPQPKTTLHRPRASRPPRRRSPRHPGYGRLRQRGAAGRRRGPPTGAAHLAGRGVAASAQLQPSDRPTVWATSEGV